MSLNVLVTGGTDGIGRLLIGRLEARGCHVAATGRREITELGADWPQNVTYLQADHADPSASAALVERIAALGWTHLDHLVINAGTGFTGPSDRESPTTIRATMNTNLISAILLANEAFAMLAAAPQRSRLTLIGSTASKGAAGFASYAASKAGLSGFARALQPEWQGRVDVQILHPGPTATTMHKKAGLDTGRMGNYFIDPDFVAASIERHMMKQRAGNATISFGARGRDRLKALFGRSVMAGSS